jgi:6-phosphogluconolactonase
MRRLAELSSKIQEVFAMSRTRIHPFITAILLAVSLLGTVFVLSPLASALAASHSSIAGNVYVLNNPAGTNSISVFDRAHNGKLTFVGTTEIGGQGSGSNLGSQGSLILSSTRQWLFAVDAGSNQISVVAVGANGQLTPTSVSSSGGVDPISLTSTGSRLYVVNAGDNSHAANVTGFQVSNDGILHPIAGSTQPLSTANPAPAEVHADPSGALLIVTEKTTNLIDSYRIHPNGSLSGPTFTPSTGNEPFGFAFNPVQTSQFIVSDAFGGATNAGAVTAYQLHHGKVTLEEGPVADHQTAPCWVAITSNGSFAYTANTGSGSVSGYGIDQNGALTLLPSSASTGTGSMPGELGLADHSRLLYVLDPGTATLSAFRVQNNGSLHPVNLGSITLSTSITGMAVD